MSNKNIFNLTGISVPLAGTEVIPIWNGSTTTKVTVSDLTAGRSVSFLDATIGAGGTGAVNTPVILNGTNQAASGSYFQSKRNGSSAWLTGDTQPALGTGSGYITYVYGANPTIWWNNVVGEQMRLNGSDLELKGGNLVPKAAAKGINFTANTPAAGMTSQLLNWYEEGTWTPNQGAGLTLVGAFSSSGTYTRVGRQVTVRGQVVGATSIATTAAGVISSNLPFTAAVTHAGSMFNSTVTASGVVQIASASVVAATTIAATSNITFTATYTV